LAKTKQKQQDEVAPAGGSDEAEYAAYVEHFMASAESAEDMPLGIDAWREAFPRENAEQPGDSNVSMSEGSVAAGGPDEDEEAEIMYGHSDALPDALPGLELEIRKAQAELVAPVTVLPSAAEFEASMAVARVLAQTKFVPESYRGSPEEVMAAIFTGRELGIGAMQSLRDIHMIDGRPVFSASLMLSQLRRGGVKILDSESTEERAFIRAQRMDTGEIAEVEWTYAQAELITRKGKKLVDGDNWKNYRLDMLWARCVGRLARRLGSDLLSGMVYTSEEMHDLEGWDTDGYKAGEPPAPPAWGEFNPGEILHPDTPKGWRVTLEWLDYVDSTVDWPFILRGVFQAKYGVESVADLGTNNQVAGRRTANLAGFLRLHVMEGQEFPPPSDDQIIEAIQWAFEGLTLDSVRHKEAEEGEVVDEGRDTGAALSPEAQKDLLNAEEAEVEFGLAEEVQERAARDADTEA